MKTPSLFTVDLTTGSQCNKRTLFQGSVYFYFFTSWHYAQGRLGVPGALHDAEEQWQSCGHCGYHGAMGRQWGITTPPGSRPGAKAVLPGVKSQISTEVVLSTERG